MYKDKWFLAGVGAIVFLSIILLSMYIRGCSSSEDLQNDAGTDETYIVESDYQTDTESDYSVIGINESESVADEDLFYLKLDGSVITIYKGDGEFYDYAQVDLESLPKDILGELKMGMEIIGEDGLYEFLQGYAS